MEEKQNLIDLYSYINKYFCRNEQTLLVNMLLSSTNDVNAYKIYNRFHSYNKLNNEIYNNENDYRIAQSESKSKLKKYIESYDKVLTDYHDNFKSYNKDTHDQLINIAEKIEIEKIRMSTENADILLFSKEVKWHLIHYREFSSLLIDMDLPVLVQGENIWWGKIDNENFSPQYKFIQTIKKFKIDITETVEENYNQIKELLLNENLLTTNVPNSNKDSTEIENHNSEVLRKVEKLSTSNPNKLKDYIR